MPSLWVVFWAVLSGLLVVAGLVLRLRIRRRIARARAIVDDDAVDAILRTGTLVTDDDEPLDLQEIEEEEERFWSESWDEPEDW